MPRDPEKVAREEEADALEKEYMAGRSRIGQALAKLDQADADLRGVFHGHAVGVYTEAEVRDAITRAVTEAEKVLGKKS